MKNLIIAILAVTAVLMGLQIRNQFETIQELTDIPLVTVPPEIQELVTNTIMEFDNKRKAGAPGAQKKFSKIEIKISPYKTSSLMSGQLSTQCVVSGDRVSYSLELPKNVWDRLYPLDRAIVIHKELTKCFNQKESTLAGTVI